MSAAIPARIIGFPRRLTPRRVVAVVACGVSFLLGVAALAILCWTLQIAGALPARLVPHAPWPMSKAMTALTGAMAAVLLHLPARRIWNAVSRSYEQACADPTTIESPNLRESNGRRAWWSRLSSTAVAATAAIELTLRGWHTSAALTVAVIAIGALDLAALGFYPARRIHHARQIQGRTNAR